MMRDLIKNGDLAGVQRAMQDYPALLDATVTAHKHTPLMWALHPNSGGQPVIAQWLVEQGVNLDLENDDGWTALMLACRFDQPDTAQLLIERGAKLDLQSNFGRSALMLACRHDQPDKAQLLIQRGAKLDLQDNDGWTALMFACRYNQPDTAQLLIERGANLDLQDNEGWTALMYACGYDQPDLAQLLIKRGANPDLQDNGGWTALMAACQPPYESHHTAAGLLRCVKLSYAGGADLDLKEANGYNALALARYIKRADAVAFLEFATMLEVARGVQGSLQQPRSVVAASLFSQDNGDTEPEVILDCAQVRYEKSQTPLMQACKNGDFARAEKLVADGAQIDARDSLDLTPMIYACSFSKEEDSLSLAKLLFEHSAGLSSETLGIKTALAHASSKGRMKLSAFLSFIHSLQLKHSHSNSLREMVVKLFDQGVRTLEKARRLTSARLEQRGMSSASDRREFLLLFVDPEQTINLEALAQKISLARTKRNERKSILHPRLQDFFAAQLLRKDPVASLTNFDRQQVILRGKELELIALQEAVKTDSTRITKRDKTRSDLVSGIRDALSGEIEGRFESILANPGTRAVIDTCHSLWKEVLEEPMDFDAIVVPVTYDQMQVATQAAMEAFKAWETRHDTSAARKRTEAAIDALDESTKRLGIQATFFMTLRHPEKTRHLAADLQNVHQALEKELSSLTSVDPMADAPLKEARRALASIISFHTCTLQNEVSRLQKAVKDLSNSLSKHVPGLTAPDTSCVARIMQSLRQSRRKRERLEQDLRFAREDANDGDAGARARIPHLEQELAQLGSAYKLDSELRKERTRVLRHAEEYYPELLRDQEWVKSLGVNNSIPRELCSLGLWLTNAKRSDFKTLSELASKPGKSVLKVRDLNGRDFVLKSFHLANEEWSSRFYRQVAALAQIKSAYIVRIQGVFMQDAHQGCTLMPFYSGGDLATWIRDNPHADLATRRRIAIGLLSGLHDLHSQGFVHCDVKPENIFLAPGLSPVLGDFDGVQMHNVTMTQHMQATFKYMAPELRRANVDRVESAVDLFSAGMVLADLFENKEVSDATTSLISSLQSADPTRRPTALQALRHEAFQVEPVKQASCAICLDIYPISEGVSCADDHFTCKECLSGSVRAATQPNAHVEVRRDGSMCCITPDCELLISGRTIASAVPEEDFAALLDIVRAHFERDAAAEQERQLRDRIDAALREHGLDPTTQNHIRAIQNEILTMSCPRCSAAFVDFDGCCALECGACPCRFCAWCLQDTGNDSRACHHHVASCASKPAGEDRFFGQKHVVRQVWCQLRAQRLRDYMAMRVEDAGVRASVQNKLRPLLTPDIVGDNFRF